MKRRIILIDAENFNGGPIATPVQARWCRRTLDNWIAPTDNDHVVIAVDESCITNVHAAWSHARLLGGTGHNGADYRLLEVMDENLPPRFDELVLVSGDRIYAEKISELAGQGLPTTVYAHNFALSKRLAFAATNVINTTTQAVQAA
ncbi:NYN domain-containing protein [Corynebacterium diphtheriae]|uniref:NYN domain-containing protein n=1 Tax=Corynebacterium diphtheriae TaxID=1717 RepID=UPI00086DA987|nr:NYN domain-containing protein [Corynebacterium diphtheriae]MBG9295020.1 NYN domain-containing protein [Corynebacterium diphtheriae bv. mitis]MBG9317631.1 NYN domain-containing protein [Corynebacterium diphtheriae bv. mitis]MBG9338293.1 NYN domain-containing protein [Corynebacterium diphtheriae bv. mitis]MBG9342443.1 NYN domain-containing protein [Corynebacterium diphtheriae]MBG9373439.1 NYN domain-containing protein [Corynebacterium diphtheriae bv. gravis]